MKHNKLLCALLAACIALTSGCASKEIDDPDTAQAQTSQADTSEADAEQAENAEDAQATAATTAKPAAASDATETQTTAEAPETLPTDKQESAEAGETSESVEADGSAEVPAVAEVSGNIGDIELKNGDLIAVFEIKDYGIIKAKLFPEIAPVGVDNFVKLAQADYFDGLNIHRVIEDFMLQGGSLNGDGTGGEAADGGNFGIEINEAARHFYGALCYANAAGRNTTQFYIVNNKQPQDLSLFPAPDELREMADLYKMQAEMYDSESDYFNYYMSMATYYRNLADMLENATPEVIAKYAEVGGTPSLDGGYTVFGQVYYGFDVIDSISACEVQYSEHDELSSPVTEIVITDVNIIEYNVNNG